MCTFCARVRVHKTAPRALFFMCRGASSSPRTFSARRGAPRRRRPRRAARALYACCTRVRAYKMPSGEKKNKKKLPHPMCRGRVSSHGRFPRAAPRRAARRGAPRGTLCTFCARVRVHKTAPRALFFMCRGASSSPRTFSARRGAPRRRRPRRAARALYACCTRVRAYKMPSGEKKNKKKLPHPMCRGRVPPHGRFPRAAPRRGARRGAPPGTLCTFCARVRVHKTCTKSPAARRGARRGAARPAENVRGAELAPGTWGAGASFYFSFPRSAFCTHVRACNMRTKRARRAAGGGGAAPRGAQKTSVATNSPPGT